MTARMEPEAKGEAIGTVPGTVRAAAAAHAEHTPHGVHAGHAVGDAATPVEVPLTARAVQGLADAPPITPRRRKPTRRSKWVKRIILVLLFGAVGAGIAIYREPLSKKAGQFIGPDKETAGLANIQTYTARRGDLRITMVEEGKLRAVNNYTIRMGVSGKITWLAEAGAKVKKGDRLATIDTKQYEDQKRTWETEIENQSKLLEIAEKQVPIAKTTGAAAVKDAQTALATAQLAYKQYKTLDAPKKLNDLENALNDARSKLADQTKKRLDFQTQLDEMLNDDDAKKTLENNLTLAKQTESTLRRTVTTTEEQRKLYRSYTYTQELATKLRAVENAEAAVQKATVAAENDALAKQAEVSRIKASVARYQTNLKQYQEIIDKGTATAPAEGLVFYGGPDLERYGMSQDSIKVGAEWYSNSPIMSIPDLSAFLVNFPIAEVYRGRVNTGMSATVTIDAIPGLVLKGSLTTVSSVSRNKVQYDSTSPPVYDATLSLDTLDPRMVAGMTVRVEIMTAALEDVIFVPVEAVFNEEGKTAVFMWVMDEAGGEGALIKGRVEKRPVLTGQASDHFVEIKKGVKEGDKLLLSRPGAFVTPRDYREQVDAMFPSAAPATAATGAAGGGAAASRATPSTIRAEFVPGRGNVTDRGTVRVMPDGSTVVVPAAPAASSPGTSPAARGNNAVSVSPSSAPSGGPPATRQDP